MKSLLFALLIGCGSERAPTPAIPTTDKPAPMVATPAPDDAVAATPEEMLERERTAVRMKLDKLIADVQSASETVENAQNGADRDLGRTKIAKLAPELEPLRATIEALQNKARGMYQTGKDRDALGLARTIMEQLSLDARELEETKLKLEETETKLVIAQNDADRAEATAKLQKLREEKAEMERQIRDAKKRSK